jgi:hypothetical protein
MEEAAARAALERLVREHGAHYHALSRLIGRNDAYLQQYVKRGTPRRLAEEDRRTLARFFGVDERVLGAAPDALVRDAMVEVPRLPLGASAGAGSLDEDERAAGAIAFDARWLHDLGARADLLSIIRVDGESMAPTLGHGDEILVDRGDDAGRLRDGIYVLRLDDVLMVKRVAFGPARGQMSVRSDNPDYRGWENVDPALVEIVGRVIWVGRRLR